MNMFLKRRLNSMKAYIPALIVAAMSAGTLIILQSNVISSCGNGVIDAGERCDDGNTKSDDGCDRLCIKEMGFECSGQPSKCEMLIPMPGTRNENTVPEPEIEPPFPLSDSEPEPVPVPALDLEPAPVMTRVNPSLENSTCSECANCGGGMPENCSESECESLGDCLFLEIFPGMALCEPDLHACSFRGVTNGGGTGSVQTDPSVFIQGRSQPRNIPAPEPVQNFPQQYYGKMVPTPAQMGPACGNGRRDAGEQCEDGNVISGDGCSAVCTMETSTIISCGDGVIAGTEQCDDGNLKNGDGCSKKCLLESANEPAPSYPSAPVFNQPPPMVYPSFPGFENPANPVGVTPKKRSLFQNLAGWLFGF